MEISIKVSEDEKYIVFTGKGEIKRDELKDPLQPLIEVCELAARSGIQRCLVDMTETRNLQGPFEDYDIVNRQIATEPKIIRSICVALVVSPEDHSHDFLEIVLRNAGFNFRLFRQREKAIEYLL